MKGSLVVVRFREGLLVDHGGGSLISIPPEPVSENIRRARKEIKVETCAFHHTIPGLAERMVHWEGKPCCIPCFNKRWCASIESAAKRALQ